MSCRSNQSVGKSTQLFGTANPDGSLRSDRGVWLLGIHPILATHHRAGWRTWNHFHERIDQPSLVRVIDALAAKNRTVLGEPSPVSLLELGYTSFGIDEGWERCGVPQHDPSGSPTVNLSAFPNMTALVQYGHGRGMTMEWCVVG